METMSLLLKQQKFSQLVAQLILHAHELGYGVTLGEAWRPDEMARLYESMGTGIRRSNHRIRLAIDLNLFKNGRWLTKSEEYEPLGVWWEKQSTADYKCIWGGRFDDGDHFSLEHQGIK